MALSLNLATRSLIHPFSRSKTLSESFSKGVIRWRAIPVLFLSGMQGWQSGGQLLQGEASDLKL